MTSAEHDLTALWHAVIGRIRTERPLLTSSVEAAKLWKLPGLERSLHFRGERPGDRSPRIRKQPKVYGNIASELTGQPLTIKCVKREGLTVVPPPREPEARRLRCSV